MGVHENKSNPAIRQDPVHSWGESTFGQPHPARAPAEVPLMFATPLLNLRPDRPGLGNQGGEEGVGGGAPDDFQDPALLVAGKTLDRVAAQGFVHGPGPGKMLQMRYSQWVELRLPPCPFHLPFGKFR